MQNRAFSLVAKVMGLIFMACGLALVAFYGPTYAKFEFGSPSDRLQILWEQDIEQLKNAGHLPQAWTDIKEVQLIPATANAKTWLKDVSVPIKLKTDGRHKLEILIISWEDQKSKGVILQYNLVDTESNNMIWELGRTFTLAGENSSF